MKIITALILLSLSTSAFASAVGASSRYVCHEVGEDSNNDNEITVMLSGKSAVLNNYWGHKTDDKGMLVKTKSNGDLVFQGFPDWVDDGQPDSGYMYVTKKLVTTGKGTIMLYNKYCEDSCTDRSAKLSCEKSK